MYVSTCCTDRYCIIMSPGRRCCVCNRTPESGEAISLHKFPQNKELSNIWAINIGRQDIIEQSVERRSSTRFVCSRHFEQTMFARQLVGGHLKKTAFPTMFDTDESPAKQRKVVRDLPLDPGPSTSRECHSVSQPYCEVASVQEQPTDELSGAIVVDDSELPENIMLETSGREVGGEHGDHAYALSRGTDPLEDDRPETATASVQTTPVLTATTPRKGKYRAQVKSLKRKLQLIQKRTAETSTAVKSPMTEDEFFQFIDTHMEENLGQFIKTQYNLAKKQTKGGRYSQDFKQFALTLYFLSGPKTYQFLRKTFRLPSRSTLLRITRPWQLPPGFNDFLFSVVKSKIDTLRQDARDCILCVDEMAIKSHLYYMTSRDEIVGFHDTGIEKTFKPATDVMVVMARGILNNWKQPIGYFFVQNACTGDELHTIIFESIRKVTDAGLNVYALISDQGSNFFSFSKKVAVTPAQPYFFVDERQIFFMFDTPHLLKTVRTHFFENNFIINEGITDKKYLELYYNHIKQLRHRQSFKLTDAHIFPDKFQKMKVRLAAQIFSQSVVSGMSLYMSKFVSGDESVLSTEALATIEFIDKMDKLFDLFNSSPATEHVTKEFVRPFQGLPYQLAFLKEMETLFNTLIVLDKQGKNITKSMRFITGWLINIAALSGIWDKLKSQGTTLFTRRLNQDCVENFFAQIRQHGGTDRNPSPFKFMCIFKKLFALNYFEHGDGSNCIEDFTTVLVHLSPENSDKKYEILLSPTTIFTPLTVDTLEYRSEKYPTENALYYICGYLMKKCLLKHTCHSCEIYGNATQTVSEETLHSHLVSRDATEDKPFGSLTMPALEFYEYIKTLDNLLCEEFHTFAIESRVGYHIKQRLINIAFSPPCVNFPVDYLLSLFVRMRLFHILKFANMELKKPVKRTKKYEKLIILQHL